MSELEHRFDQLMLAAKAFKLAVEEACRLLWVDQAEAERMLMQALKRAEEDGL